MKCMFQIEHHSFVDKVKHLVIMSRYRILS